MIDAQAEGVPFDGVADSYPKLQDLLLSERGDVYLGRGRYPLSQMLQLPAGSALYGPKDAVVVRAHPNSMIANGYSGMPPVAAYEGRGHIRLQGFTMHADGLNITTKGCGVVLGHGTDILIEDLTFLDFLGNHAIECNASRDVTLRDLRFEGFTPHSTNNVPIEAIQFDVASQVGFGTWGQFDGTPCKTVTVDNCWFGPSSNMPAWPRGIGSHGSEFVNYHEDIRIVGCKFYDTEDTAMAAWYWRDFVMEGNRIYRPKKDGIEIKNTYFATLLGNRVFDAEENGVVFDSNGTAEFRNNLLIGSGRKTDNVYKAFWAKSTDNLDMTGNRCRMRSTGNNAKNGAVIEPTCDYLRWGSNDFNTSGRANPSVVNGCATTTLMGANAL